jgi:hypothetical protein
MAIFLCVTFSSDFLSSGVYFAVKMLLRRNNHPPPNHLDLTHATGCKHPRLRMSIGLHILFQYSHKIFYFLVLYNNSVNLVHEQTIPIERPPLVGEDSVNFC